MKRNFGLDLIRTFSIWLVLFQHGNMDIPGLSPLRIGVVGVEIFFVLSGFLIGGILFKELDKNEGIWKTLKTFWVRRWFRILPLYYAILLFKFIVIDNSIGWNLLYYIFFLQNNFYGIDFLGVSWSLVIEEWFYIFTPIFLLFVSRVLKTSRNMVFSLIAFLIVVNIARFFYVYFGNIPWQGVNGNFAFRFDSLFLGVILAFLQRYKSSFFSKLSTWKVFVFGLASFLGYLLYYRSMASPEYLIDSSLFPRTIGFFILPLSIALFIPFIASFSKIEIQSIPKKALYHFVTRSSVYTYAIYLIHPFIFEPVYSGALSVGSSAGKFLCSIVITYLLAAMAYHFFERPILKYRDKITKQKSVTL